VCNQQDFGEQLEHYAVDVESYHTKSEIIKREQIAAEVGGGTLRERDTARCVMFQAKLLCLT
jgi:hypothetical protein